MGKTAQTPRLAARVPARRSCCCDNSDYASDSGEDIAFDTAEPLHPVTTRSLVCASAWRRDSAYAVTDYRGTIRECFQEFFVTPRALFLWSKRGAITPLATDHYYEKQHTPDRVRLRHGAPDGICIWPDDQDHLLRPPR